MKPGRCGWRWDAASRCWAMRTQAADLDRSEQIPLADTRAAMEDLVTAGLTRHIGVSHVSSFKLRALVAGAWIRHEALQGERYPLLQHNSLLETCREEGVAVNADATLGPSGPGLPPLLLEAPEVLAIAREREITAAQLLLGWGLACDTALILKSVRPVRLADNRRPARCSSMESPRNAWRDSIGTSARSTAASGAWREGPTSRRQSGTEIRTAAARLEEVRPGRRAYREPGHWDRPRSADSRRAMTTAEGRSGFRAR